MKSIVPILLLSAVPATSAPIAGAWESFATEANAEAWGLYVHASDEYFSPGWVGPEIDPNPYAYSFFDGDDAIEFFADSFVGDGAFVGDYQSQKIRGVELDAYLDPAELDFLDLAVFTNGPGGLRYYYSAIYTSEDLGEETDWYPLQFAFGDSWFYFEDNEWRSFNPGDDFLTSVEEISIRFFPREGIVTESYVGIDNVILLPTVEAPALTTSVSSGMFRLTFTPNPGVACGIEKLSISPPLSWDEVAGWQDLTGPQLFETPLVEPSGIFRVRAEEKFTQIPEP